MNKKLLFLLTAAMSVQGIANADDAANYIRKYMSVVYPTSTEIQKMSDQQLKDYYATNLNTWYRVPEPKFESGLFDSRITPQYRVFVFPDTAARSRTDLDNEQKLAKNGFTSEKTILGSNKDYIEISSLAWMSFPFGGYLNWAHGSGIYLYTGGKTISGYTKVDVLYKIYDKHHQLSEYYNKLGSTHMVKGQIFGSDLPLDQVLSIYADSNNKQDYAKKVAYNDFMINQLHIASGAEPLAVVLLDNPKWSHEHEKIKKLVAQNKFDEAYLLLVKVYVEDHRLGQFDQADARYKYLGGEAMPDLDEWMYDAAKAEGYNVVQMTYEPNSMGQPTFELCDLRWPKLTGIPNIAYDAIDKGLQHYSLEFAWNKSAEWLSVRDPLDLNNQAKARPVKVVLPDLNDKVDSTKVLNPPAKFPTSWLPKDGWNAKLAQGHYHQTDTFVAWVVPQPAPKGLLLNENKGRFVTWGLSDESGFSFTDFNHNQELLSK